MAAAVHFRAVADIVADDLATVMQAANRCAFDPNIRSAAGQRKALPEEGAAGCGAGGSCGAASGRQGRGNGANDVGRRHADSPRKADVHGSPGASRPAAVRPAPPHAALQTTFVDAIRQVFALAIAHRQECAGGRGARTMSDALCPLMERGTGSRPHRRRSFVQRPANRSAFCQRAGSARYFRHI